LILQEVFEILRSRENGLQELADDELSGHLDSRLWKNLGFRSAHNEKPRQRSQVR